MSSRVVVVDAGDMCHRENGRVFVPKLDREIWSVLPHLFSTIWLEGLIDILVDVDTSLGDDDDIVIDAFIQKPRFI